MDEDAAPGFCDWDGLTAACAQGGKGAISPSRRTHNDVGGDRADVARGNLRLSEVERSGLLHVNHQGGRGEHGEEGGEEAPPRDVEGACVRVGNVEDLQFGRLVLRVDLARPERRYGKNRNTRRPCPTQICMRPAPPVLRRGRTGQENSRPKMSVTPLELMPWPSSEACILLTCSSRFLTVSSSLAMFSSDFIRTLDSASYKARKGSVR